MNRIMRLYNTNRKAIWTTIGLIVFILILIKLINTISHYNLNEEKDETVNMNSTSLMNSISMDNDESTVSGEKLSTTQTSMLETLDEFANYCSLADIDNAYNLLSEDCKEELYPTKEAFQTVYYNNIFNGTKKNISAENWVGNTYKVKYREDALSTGVYDENPVQDYITIIKDEDGNVKLNINGYIGKEELNVTEEQNDIQIKVLETNIYMDYQTFTYEITNKTDKTIILNDPNIDDTMYIEDKNEVKYQAYIHEMSLSELKILSQERKKLTIKYYNKYSSSKIIENIVFARMILDYGAYTNYQNPGYYNNYGTINIEL